MQNFWAHSWSSIIVIVSDFQIVLAEIDHLIDLCLVTIDLDCCPISDKSLIQIFWLKSFLFHVQTIILIPRWILYYISRKVKWLAASYIILLILLFFGKCVCMLLRSYNPYVIFSASSLGMYSFYNSGPGRSKAG